MDKSSNERNAAELRLGLIGNPLGHSWSPEIHRFLTGADYRLWQMEESELDGFFARREFDGINVTIPYKAAVIPYLDSVDEAAARMGAVNCIVNEGGRLTGYNTDYIGLARMMRRGHINEEGGRAAILGTGGASKAAEEVCRQMGWDCVMVSRSSKAGCISYDELYNSAAASEGSTGEETGGAFTLLINATPVGMHPNEEACPVDLSRLPGLGYVVDIVANPVRTRLCYEAALRGIRTAGGLEMLAAQALAAEELFLGRALDDRLTDECVNHLLSERRNTVLIGMPSSGKSTVGQMLAGKLGREFIDTDDEIIARAGMPIADFFARYGEPEFRKIESEVCGELSERSGLVIACGGGAVESADNMRRLAYNGLMVYIDRALDMLTPTESRPLSPDRERLARLYERRKGLYERYSDVHIVNDGEPQDAAEAILSAIRSGDSAKI